MPDTQIQEQHRHYEIVALIIGYLREHAHRQPSLKGLADSVGLSEFYLQRIFAGGKVAVILSGGNVDMSVYANIIKNEQRSRMTCNESA